MPPLAERGSQDAASRRPDSSGSMSTRTTTAAEYVVCVENVDYPVSLELHKIYRALPDEDALAAGDLRVVDESGEDYLFPATALVAISLPERVRSSLRHTSAS